MNIHIIKLGGRVATDESVLKTFLREASKLPEEDGLVIVHGGGAEVSQLSQTLGHAPRFIDGVRMTTPEEMPVVDMVLAGKMNKYIVRLGFAAGLDAVGVSGCDGGLFTGGSIAPGNRTGKISRVNPRLLSTLIEKGFTPVVSSVSMDDNGDALNINADEAALAVAKAMKAVTLVYISDIPGVLHEEKVIPYLDGASIDMHIAQGTISGGMVPKVRSAFDAVKNGVQAVIIGGYGSDGDLGSLLSKTRGTAIVEKVGQ